LGNPSQFEILPDNKTIKLRVGHWIFIHFYGPFYLRIFVIKLVNICASSIWQIQIGGVLQFYDLRPPKIVVIELWIKWITRTAISYATKCRKIADRIH